jgi:ligand-binding sensor domain-containing protein/signal transduction histidine kinase
MLTQTVRNKWIAAAILLTVAVAQAEASQVQDGSLSDSREFVPRVWRAQDGLPENLIQAISETPDGYLWVGTPGGLVRFDGARFVVYNRANNPAFANDSIHVIYAAQDSSLWIGTDGGGLVRLKNGTFQTYGQTEGLTNGFVKAVYQDHAGQVWVTTAHGFFHLSGNRFVRVVEPDQLTVSAFWDIVEKSDSGLWVRSTVGWYQVRDDRLAGDPVERSAISQISDPGCANVALRGIVYRDHLGDLWIGGNHNGLTRIHNCAITTFHSPRTLPGSTVTAIWEDREHSLWIGTEDGLLRLSRTTLTTLDQDDGLSENNVTTAYEDRSGVVWVTTVTGDVFRIVQGKIVPYRLPDQLADYRVTTVFEDSAGAMYFSLTSQGFAKIVDGHATVYTMQDGFRSNLITAFFEGSQGDLWIGTSSGLSHWNGHEFRNYYLQDGLVYGWVRVIAQDRNGDLLIGTDAGVSRLRGDKIVPDNLLAQAGRDRIHAIHVDSSGYIWLGTRGAGLIRVGDGKVFHLTKKSGLLSDTIYQVLEDASTRLWMSSPAGVFSVSLHDLNAVASGQAASVAAAAYGLADGMPSTQMSGSAQPAGSHLPDGQLIFPSVKGLVIIDPRHVRVDEPSPVHVESVIVDDVPVPLTGSIVIPPGHRKLQIDFTACSLLSAERLSFRYRLRGLSDSWSVATNTRSAQYSSLPPRDYTFEVVAQDGAIPGSVSQASIGFVWQPHFFQTWWFYVATILLSCALMFGGVAFYANQQRLRYNLRLEERARVARDMHDTIIQGCIGASTLLEAAVGCAEPEPLAMTDFLNRARIQLRLTLDEARQALTDLRHDSFAHGLGGALEELSMTVSQEMNLPVEVKIDGRPTRLNEHVSRNLLLVAREAIRNAIAHAEPTRIKVLLSFAASRVQLEIQDDGCGFVAGAVRSAAADHFGIIGMRERVEQMGGSFDLRTSPGEGTSAIAVLPL